MSERAIGNTTKDEKMFLDLARYQMELLNDPADWTDLVFVRARLFAQDHLNISPTRLRKLFNYALQKHIGDYLSRK